MIFRKLSIRWKLTLSNILLLAAVSVMLYIGSNQAADRAMESIPMVQIVAQSTEPIDTSPHIIPATPLQTPLQAAKKNHRSTMVLYTVCTILLGGAITFAITKGALKPLEDFEQRIKDTDWQKLSHKISIPSAEPEVACLINAFNEMTDKLEESFVLQKQFSHSVAHELRTPLTVIRTKIEVFQKKEQRTPEEYHALLSTIQEYTQNLTTMVEDILKYSNLSYIPLDDHIQLNHMLLQVVSEMNAIYSKCDIAQEPCNISCRGNTVLLHRVCSNIIENACRYYQDECTIHIRVTKQSMGVTIQISDHGMGIKDCDKELIFKPFFRVDTSRSRELGGVGLGLFFCKEIISKHGGQISVTDHLPRGTTFTITLPA